MRSLLLLLGCISACGRLGFDPVQGIGSGAVGDASSETRPPDVDSGQGDAGVCTATTATCPSECSTSNPCPGCCAEFCEQDDTCGCAPTNAPCPGGVNGAPDPGCCSGMCNAEDLCQ